MSENIMDKLEELQIYLRNNIQEILICKHEDTEELFLVDTIFDSEVLEGVDLERLKNDIVGIHSIDTVDEGTRIITNYAFHPSLKDTINDPDKKIPLERQMHFANFIVDRLLELKHLSLPFLDSLFNENDLIVDKNGNLQMLGSIILNPNYESITVQDIFNRLANVLHIIFSGNEIVDGEVDENLPPDIRRIITNSVNNHYMKFSDLASDFKASSVFKLVNPEQQEGHKVHLMRKNLRNKRRYHYLRKYGLKIAVILIVLIPLIVLASNRLFNPSGNDTDPVYDDTPDIGDNQGGENDVDDNPSGDIGDDIDEQDPSDDTPPEEENDDLRRYYNDELLDLASNDSIGVLDDSQQYRGTHSVKVSNSDNQNKSTLIGIIDLNEDGFSFLKNRKSVDVSMWLKSDNNTEGVITLKLMNKNNNIVGSASLPVSIPGSMWTLHSHEINTYDGDYIKMYITPKNNGDIWVDSILPEILK